MKLKKDEKWILVENLKEQERRERTEVSEGLFDGSGDFGSYYALQAGVNSDWIKAHGLVDDRLAYFYARQIFRSITKSCLRSQFVFQSILDVGCGIGPVTNALRQVFGGSNTTGVDISVDAVKYASGTYPRCKFIEMALSENSVLPDKYSIIHAREFYPFTRTNSEKMQLEYFRLFSRYLNNQGLLIVQFVARSEGLHNTLKRLEAELGAVHLKLEVDGVLPSLRIWKFVPYKIAYIVTMVEKLLRKKYSNRIYIFRKE